MPESEMKKAVELLEGAQQLLARSEVKNLRLSSEYLKASILLLRKDLGVNSPAQKSR